MHDFIRLLLQMYMPNQGNFYNPNMYAGMNQGGGLTGLRSGKTGPDLPPAPGQGTPPHLQLPPVPPVPGDIGGYEFQIPPALQVPKPRPPVGTIGDVTKVPDSGYNPTGYMWSG
jgi:hypothetical protein